MKTKKQSWVNAFAVKIKCDVTQQKKIFISNKEEF